MISKEQLLYFIISKRIRVHYSDQRFFNNMLVRVRDNKQITTGQAELFNRLIKKYERELHGNKCQLTTEQMLALPWSMQVVNTTSDYTSARVSLNDNCILIQTPMNKNFIRKFENIKETTYKWQKATKEYSSPFSTHALKLAYDILPKYFAEVRYCDQLQKLIDHTKSYPKCIWKPTLKKINNHMFIVSSNEVVDKLIENIELNESPNTYFLLSRLGVDIYPTLINDTFDRFASQSITTITVDQLDIVIEWLKKLNIKAVFLDRGVNTWFHKTKSMFHRFITNLTSNNIEILSFDSEDLSHAVVFQYHGNDVLKYYGNRAPRKFVFITNPKPIEVK